MGSWHVYTSVAKSNCLHFVVAFPDKLFLKLFEVLDPDKNMRMLPVLFALIFLHGTLVLSTSVVSPIVEVTARSEYDSSTVAERAIDNDVDTIYFSKMDKPPEWLKLTLPEGSNMEKVVIIPW